MKDLNEKLATEVMGWTSDGGYNYFSETNVAADWTFHEEKGDRGLFVYPSIWWNPAGDEPNLNQLRECYLALSEDEKELYKSVSGHGAPHILDDPARHAKYIVKIREKTILKAKGVE